MNTDLEFVDVAFRTGRHRTLDGLTIEYRDYSSGQATDGPTVICLHGLTRNLRDFEDVAPRIAALGFRVIVPSQRGRGGSDYDPNPDNYHPGQYAEDMIGLLDSLKIKKAFFVGSSMGGIMTMLISQTRPDLIIGAVLNDIGIALDPVGVDRIMGYVGAAKSFVTWQEAARACRATNGHAFPLETSPQYWEQFARRVCVEREGGEIEFDYDLNIAVPTQNAHAVVPDFTDAFKCLAQKPVLLVRGETSDLLARETVKAMAAIHPSLEVFEVANIGHVPFLSEPEAWRTLARFLTRVFSKERSNAEL